MPDRSNGYEGVAAEFLAGRGRAPSTAIGTSRVRDWARTLPRGSAVLDVGCGSGLPITKVLIDEGLNVSAIDAAPSLVEAFRNNFPQVPVACESAVDSLFFERTFEGVISWGLMFLLQPHEQRRLIQRIADILVPGGRLLFTSEAEPLMWNDAMTGLESRSLGAAEYRRLLSSVGLSVVSEYEDEGENYYFDAVKKGTVAVSHRSRLFFLLLVVAQVAHSVEEYATRLYEVFAPARLVSELFSDDVAVGFVIANAIIITVGIWCYVGPVRSGRGAARLVAWLWTVIELANGIGHIILAVLARGYFPGAMTAVVLVYAAASLALSLRADWHRTHRLTRYCEAPWF